MKQSSLEEWIVDSPGEMHRLGVDLAVRLQPGSLFYLEGDLGAGKTQLVKGIACGLGFSGEATSPTFTLINEYPCASGPLFHIDLYRVQTADEIPDLGLDELVACGVVCIEWADRFWECLPRPSAWIRIRFLAADRREVVFSES